MKNYKSTLKVFGSSTAAAFMLLLLPAMAMAETVVRGGESVSVGDSQLVEGDFYAYGGTVTHSGAIESDMYAAAGSVVINGSVGTDLTVLGGSTQIHAAIGDDVRLVTGQAVIADEIQGDLFVIGGVLNVLSSAHIKGNVYFYGGQANIEGQVSGSVMGMAERFYINNQVGGDIDVTGSVSLGNQADVAGDLNYNSLQELSRAQNAVVAGSITRSEIQSEKDDSGKEIPIATFLIWTFTALVVYLVLRRRLAPYVRGLESNLAYTALFGLVGMLVTPVVAVVLMVTVLGFWLGVLTLLVWLPLVLISMLLLPIFLGDRLMRWFKPNAELNWLTVVVGVLATIIVMYLPYLGCLLVFLGTIMVFGYLLLTFYRVVKDKV